MVHYFAVKPFEKPKRTFFFLRFSRKELALTVLDQGRFKLGILCMGFPKPGTGLPRPQGPQNMYDVM
jgi:hypothetical protein